MHVSGAVHTDRGKVRRENQDSYGLSAGLGLYLVADGMGGQAAGKRASEEATRVVTQALEASNGGGAGGEKRLREAIDLANRHVWQLSQSEPGLLGMGTTIAAVLIADGMAYIGHVGDSRVYRLRGGKIERLTRDHSFSAELAERGIELRDDRVGSRYAHLLTRAVGIAPTVEVEVASQRIDVNDTYIICSDGIYGLVDPSEIQQIIEADQDLARVCGAIVARANAAGGSDNSTVIVLRVEANEAGERT